MTQTDSKSLTNAIQSNYGAVADSSLSGDHAGVRAVANAFGYSDQELSSIPAAANMGLSCGNPIAQASLRPGETVVDLGCGGGLDIFLASGRVGPTGRAIGIDMTPAMIDRARRNAATGPDGKPFSNVEFHLAAIDAMPLADASADCVISNCVINLAPDKPAVFREIFRVLKPGGRVALSDIALHRPLPALLRESIAALVGCIGGAILLSDYKRMLIEAGFEAVDVVDSGSDLNAYAKVENQSACCSPAAEPADSSATSASGCCGESSTSGSSCCSTPADAGGAVHKQLAELLRKYDVNDYAASVKVFAIKPANG